MFSQESGRSRSYRTLKSVAGVTSFAMTWLAVAPTAMAAMRKAPKPAGHTRQLNAQEMQRIWGAQTMPPDPTPDGGGGQGGNPNGWEGGSGGTSGGGTTTGGGGTTTGGGGTTTGGGGTTTGGGGTTTGGGGGPLAGPGGSGTTNSINGNKVTNVPLVGWTAKGGLPMGLTLYHNSEGTYNGEFGQKWTFSWAIYLTENANTGDITVHHGDDLPHTFVKNMDGSFTPPAGVNDTVSQRYFVPPSQGGAQGGPSDFTYTVRGSGVVYHFNPSGASASKWVCDTITDANSNVVTIARDASTDGALSVSDPSGRSLTFAYTRAAKSRSATDPLGRVWTFGYDTATGDLTTITLPELNGQTYSLQFGYNARHDITSQTDARGKTWTFTYNSDDSQASATDPLNHTTTWAYTSASTITTDANGHAQTQTYDASGRLVSITDALGHSVSYAYDADNNKITVTDALGNATHYTYNAQGDVLTATDPLNHTVSMTYNNRGQVLTAVLPSGKQYVKTYDAYGNALSLANPMGTVSTMAYNTDGTLASKTDSNNRTTSYGYNTYGSLTSLTTPGGKVTQFTCDTLGTRTGQTDAMGRTAATTLDAWERPTFTSSSAPGTPSKSFTYDAGGNVLSFTDGTGTTSRAYDDMGRMTSETTNQGTVSYVYDASGKIGLLSQASDPSGRTTTYTYTAANQLASVTEGSGSAAKTTSYAYDNTGQEIGISNANGTSVEKAYDTAKQLASITNRSDSGTVLSSFAYGYTNDGRRSSCTEADGSVVSYAYDNAGHLTGEARTGSVNYSASYAVDGEGNRLSQTINGATSTFTYDTNDALLSVASTDTGGLNNTYAYNNNGEQTGRTLNGVSYALTYDGDGQITHITGGANGATDTTFAYDAGGRRVVRTAAGSAATHFVYSGAAVLLEKENGAVTASYTYGNALVGKNGNVNLCDGLGTSRQTTSVSGAVVSERVFEGFGQTVAATGTHEANGYAATSGYRDDGDAGLMHVGARYYDASVGRFLSRDTYLDQKPYTYCEADPINAVDPSGHMPGWVKGVKDFFAGWIKVEGQVEFWVGVGVGSYGAIIGNPVAAVGGYLIAGIGYAKEKFGDWLYTVQ